MHSILNCIPVLHTIKFAFRASSSRYNSHKNCRTSDLLDNRQYKTNYIFYWGPIPAGKSTVFPRYVTFFFLYTNFPCLLSILDLTLALIFNIVQETNVQKHSKVLHAHTLTTLKVYKGRVAGQTYSALYSSVLLYCEPVVKNSWQVAHLEQ